MKVAIFLAAFVAVTLGKEVKSRTGLHKEHFTKFALKHGKSYKGEAEVSKRLGIYSKRKEEIDRHNEQAAKGLQSYFMAENRLSDRTDEELKAYTGAVLPSRDRLLGSSFNFDERQTVPSSVDLRNDKCMPPVKNQGQCGSCWSFPTVNPLEYQLCKRSGVMTPLAEQQLLSCSGQACQGGFYLTAWNYLKKAGGIMKESDYPYVAKNSTCTFSSSKAAVNVGSFGYVARNETALKITVAQKGPIAVCVVVTKNFYAYSSGIFNDNLCPVNTEDCHHAVTLVGYGTSASGDYWIVRNSWGSWWGMNGYMLIKRGVNMCNIDRWVGWVSIA